MGVAVQADDETRYQTWQGDDTATAALVERLNQLIDDAERARAADPNFLADLRVTIDDKAQLTQQAPEPVESSSSARASTALERAAAPQDSGGSLLSTITNSLDSITSGDGLLDSLTGGSSTGSDTSSGGGVLSNADIGAGLRQALEFAAETVVSQLGAVDGFKLD